MQTSRWPDACDSELRQHVAQCASCTELLTVARALLDDSQSIAADTQLPSSAIVWWRAQMRSRREAATVVTQPITVVQGLIAASAAGLLVAAAGAFVPTFRRIFARILAATDSLPGLSGVSLTITPETLTSPIFISSVAAVLFCAIVLPLALYFTFQEE
jgi:hypothetical protein